MPRPTMIGQYTDEFLRRFWAKIDVKGEDDCWLWTARLNVPDGYGFIAFNRTALLAHRIAYELAYGDPGELFVLHKCDVRVCCNPKHLFLGTLLDNNRDRAQKGRSAHLKGKLNGMCKLTDEQIAEIRRLYAAGGTSHRKLAVLFGIDHSHVGDIVRRETRTDIP